MRTGGGSPPSTVPGRGHAASLEMEQAAAVTQAFTVQGPQQALAMLQGMKLLENRAWRIPPGWYALHVGSQRKSEWGERAAARHPELPSEEELEDHFGTIVGLLHIVEQRRVEECNGNQWAYGPVCHVVSHGLRFAAPIRQRGDKGLWPLSARLRGMIAAQLPDASLVQHDLSVLEPSSAGVHRASARGGGRHGIDRPGGRGARGGPARGISFYGAKAEGLWTSFSSTPSAASADGGPAPEHWPRPDDAPLRRRGGRGRTGRQVPDTTERPGYPSYWDASESTQPWSSAEHSGERYRY
mmetsp:Transcript_47252/g.136527  ORF Transcript_47252/g.136527 Transcript_47252/m.136527 type:complete len:298 (-) Transcript_47252:68-961(-)